ncbi:glycosyltransferase [Vibrio vulnificus]|nr:glycosyltransferase [Vibrio vulnificus]
MKVLHFISAPAAGGAEVYVKDLARHASRKGQDTAVVFLGDAKSIGRCQVYERKYLSELDECNIKYYFLKPGSRKNIIGGFFSLNRILKEYRPDIIHCHLFYAVAYSFLFRKKIVYTHHNVVMKINRFLFGFFNRYIDVYIGICGVCSDVLRTYTKKTVVEINNAVDVERIKKKSPPSIRNHVNIIMVGGLIEQKNYSLAIKTVRLLHNDSYKLLIAGEGEMRPKLEKIISDYNLHDNVVLMGNVSNIQEVYDQADVFLMTSLWEGLPIALLEASVRGIAVVVTDVGGCGEVVNNMNNGYVIKDFSPTDIADCLKKLIESPMERNRISKQVMERSHVYDISSAYQSHYELYRELVN